MNRFEREQDFWDSHVPALTECIREVEGGPDSNTARALEVLAPLSGQTVLDVGCGPGVLSAWLAYGGARVTGVDLSPQLIARAAELHTSLGLDSHFIASPVSELALGGHVFDRLAGRFVLHHLDPPSTSRDLAAMLRPGGRGAFVETMGIHPVVRSVRAHLTGRYGIPRYGTDDERPLTGDDLAALQQAFGGLRLEVAEMQFFGILDRQLLRYRFRTSSVALRKLDALLLRAGLDSWSYRQVVILTKTNGLS